METAVSTKQLSEDKLRAIRSKEYQQFVRWAERDIADTVIRSGFRELSSAVARVVQVYRLGEERNWMPIKENRQ